MRLDPIKLLILVSILFTGFYLVSRPGSSSDARATAALPEERVVLTEHQERMMRELRIETEAKQAKIDAYNRANQANFERLHAKEQKRQAQAEKSAAVAQARARELQAKKVAAERAARVKREQAFLPVEASDVPREWKKRAPASQTPEVPLTFPSPSK